MGLKNTPLLSEHSTTSDLYMLALEKHKSGDYHEAIDTFLKSLALKEDRNSYQ